MRWLSLACVALVGVSKKSSLPLADVHWPPTSPQALARLDDVEASLRHARVALAFSYFADGAKRLPREGSRRPHAEDAESYAAWTKGRGAVKPGRPAAHRLLPLVWAAGPVPTIAAPDGQHDGS